MVRRQAIRTRGGWTSASLLAVAWILIGCAGEVNGSGGGGEAEARERSGPTVPMSIHGMPVVGMTTGRSAERLIGRLHGTSVAPLTSYVSRYEGGGARATLYLSRFEGRSVADSVLRAMARSIGSENRAFAHHTRITVGGREVHAVLGQGQAHFFYALGPDVVWLGIDPRMARVGLADLLDVEVALLPAEGVEAGGVNLLPPPDSLYRR